MPDWQPTSGWYFSQFGYTDFIILGIIGAGMCIAAFISAYRTKKKYNDNDSPPISGDDNIWRSGL